MKWPEELTIVRHGQSNYNVLKERKEKDPFYQEFKKRYKEIRDWEAPISPEIVEMAKEVSRRFSLGASDFAPMTEVGTRQAIPTGAKLKELISIPDVIFVSPFVRTLQTLTCFTLGWPELKRVETYPDERIREKSPGLAALYNDWRVFNVLHPEQKRYRDLFGKLAEYWYAYPNGENVHHVRELIRSWVNTLVREYTGKKVLAISHHLTILAMRAHLERLDPEEFIRLDREEKPVNCGVTIYRGDPNQGENGKLVLVQYNRKLYD